MPGWHEATRELQKQGKLQLIGLIQEQHPDRCSLFMQWKNMDWPVLIDPLNLLGVSAVPITLLIDEHGIVRGKLRNARSSKAKLEKFLATDYPKTDRPAFELNAMETAVAKADDLFLDGGLTEGRASDLTKAIQLYRDAIEKDPQPEYFFRLGVALRRRYETDQAATGDFQSAVDAWSRALELRPGQYIWRRRIQQYGPRLDKPYSFYDWVHQARREITSRGGKPAPLRVEPDGAEIAKPARRLDKSAKKIRHPDPAGKLPRDSDKLIKAEVVAVPSTLRRGKPARIHVEMKPDKSQKAHWNNEAGFLVAFIDAPSGVEVDRESVQFVPRTKNAVSTEERSVEFELLVSKEFTGREIKIPISIFYYVCEDATGVCLFLRQDVKVQLAVR